MRSPKVCSACGAELRLRPHRCPLCGAPIGGENPPDETSTKSVENYQEGLRKLRKQLKKLRDEAEAV